MVFAAKSHAVYVLSRNDTGRFLINKESRHPKRRYLFTCPGGRIEEKEEPEKAAAFLPIRSKKTQDPKLESFKFIPLILLTKESLYQELKDGAEIDSALATALLYSSIL